MNKSFNRAVSLSSKIVFNPAWANGTGYFNHASEGTSSPKLSIGQIVTCRDTYGRDMLIVGAIGGNAVIFQRHTGNKLDGVIVGNIPAETQEAFEKVSELSITSRIEDNAVESLLDMLDIMGATQVL